MYLLENRKTLGRLLQRSVHHLRPYAKALSQRSRGTTNGWSPYLRTGNNKNIQRSHYCIYSFIHDFIQSFNSFNISFHLSIIYSVHSFLRSFIQSISTTEYLLSSYINLYQSISSCIHSLLHAFIFSHSSLLLEDRAEERNLRYAY